MEDLIRISVEGPSLEDFDARESVASWFSQGHRSRLLVNRLLVSIAYTKIWVHLTFVLVHLRKKVSLEPCVYIYRIDKLVC